MFTQFFGNYLLNQKLVTSSQLIDALGQQKSVRLKLGVLAMNAGFMNANQVDEIHSMQASIDKRFGELAKDKGYLTDVQITELLCEQPTRHLLLGQSLVDMGIMSNDEFEHALNSYKRLYALTDGDFTNTKNNKYETTLNEFFQLYHVKNNTFLLEYLSLLFKNLVRFIGDDFTPLDVRSIETLPVDYAISQEIDGKFSVYSAISCSEESVYELAKRYANEEISAGIDYALACICEFLNLHNGLFTVNVSNLHQVELELNPPNISMDTNLNFESKFYCMPVCFSFGTVDFVLAIKD